MIKSLMKRTGFGFMLGVAVCSVIAALIGDGSPIAPEFAGVIGSAKGALLLQLLLTGLCGALCMGGTVLYDVDRLPLSLQTLCHCLLCVIPYFGLSLLLHWVERIADALVFSGVQLAAFFIIWLILFLRFRKQTEELNDIRMKNHLRPEENNTESEENNR